MYLAMVVIDDAKAVSLGNAKDEKLYDLPIS